MNCHEETPNRTIGVVADTGDSLDMKTMADKMFTCIAKNYKVDQVTKKDLSNLNRAGVKAIDAPTEPMNPVYMSLKQAQKKPTDSDSDDDMMTMATSA